MVARDVSSEQEIFTRQQLALQSMHGFRTIGEGAGNRDAAGGENAGAGSGRSDRAES